MINFDVIILTYNSENKLLRLISSIKKQTFSPRNILVIDSNSNDNTIKIARENGCIVYIIDKEKFDHGAARSYAAKLSKSDFLIFLTDDVEMYNSYSFENILNLFCDDSIGAVFGRQVPYDNTNIFGKQLRYFNYPEKSYVRTIVDKYKYGIKTPFLSNSFCAYRAKALQRVGYFKDRLIIGEDTYVGAKLLLANYKIVYSCDGMVYHSHNYSVLDEFRRYFDIGVFHKTENWILKEFGSAKNEGFKYILSGIKYLIKIRKIYLLFEFFIRIFFKYLAYKLGYNYKWLPKFLIIKFTMHKRWWKNNNIICK